MRKKFVVLKKRYHGEFEAKDSVYDTVKAAVCALNEIGCCCNWAVLTKGYHHVLLFYEARVYLFPAERSVFLPFTERSKSMKAFARNIESLLKKIFSPFIKKDQSFFRVKAKKEFAFVTLNLFFPKGCHLEIAKVLERVSDSVEEVKATFYCLD